MINSQTFRFLYPLFRNDKAWCPWFCHWRPEWRRGEGRLLADGYLEHWPLTARKTSISDGCRVRKPVDINLCGDIFFLNLSLMMSSTMLQVCRWFGSVCCSRMWYVWLCLPHPHCSKCSLFLYLIVQIPQWQELTLKTILFIFSQRFGSALVPWGSLQLRQKQFAKDFQPIDPNCHCPTCKT